MNLSYRGISYQSKSPVVEPGETTQTARFLGNPYKVLQARVVQHQNSAPLKYRGIDYNA
ncbi:MULTISPECIES: DUF4278 domain-containing protein [unclassified Leptolyngbya]|uniref:DUF4278 domain-containing protein n=1 Tax=unclassified Leptolyngbya TaxID=2650499 RepID=UPI001683792F|nr:MULTISPECIES: DUF4278 domain-containing protein [unclassified Leptolyngbya]MBD1909641.1 DUF4278 domain-containing protein [Leptolyngbya sp. FACHB-8]MBD2157582.1 DUF4278 domain-containing protein [Leptolyngbya sp. FACHB-16]